MNRESNRNQRKFQSLHSPGHNPQKCHFVATLTNEATHNRDSKGKLLPHKSPTSKGTFESEKCPSTAIFTPPKSLSTRSYLFNVRPQLSHCDCSIYFGRQSCQILFFSALPANTKGYREWQTNYIVSKLNYS